MSRVLAAAILVTAAAAAAPTAASAGCYGCYVPPQPCGACYQPQYQQQYVPPQYRTVQETVMVAPARVVAHRTPAQYRTVMVPKTVMVAPEGVQYGYRIARGEKLDKEIVLPTHQVDASNVDEWIGKGF